MATYQQTYHLASREAVAAHPGRAITLDDEWWLPDLSSEAISALSGILPATDSWHPDLHAWGSRESDLLEVFGHGPNVFNVTIRFDLSTSGSTSFRASIAAVVLRIGCVLVGEDGVLLEPNLPLLTESLASSRAAAFVRDPAGYLERLQRHNAGPA